MHNSGQFVRIGAATSGGRRHAFTLVEMLVAMGIILLLGAITFAFLPTVQDKQRVSRGASLLQGWLATAKNLAYRDQRPRGVRLSGKTGAITGAANSPIQITSAGHGLATGTQVTIQGVGGNLAANGTWTITFIDANTFSLNGSATSGAYTSGGNWYVGTLQITTCQYIDQPDDLYQGGQLQIDATPGTASLDSAPNTVTYTVNVPTPGSGPVNFYGGFPNSNPAAWPIQPGDYLEIGSPPTLFKITAYPSGPPPAPCQQLLCDADSSASAVGATGNYRFVRQPRVRLGSPSLDLPENVVIDLRTNTTYTTYGSALPVNSATQNVEILFSPSGGVMGLGSGNDKIQLWLRDSSMDATSLPLNSNATFLGDQILVTVYVRSGFISANPVDTTLTTGTPPYQYVDPYAFTRDARSGL